MSGVKVTPESLAKFDGQVKGWLNSVRAAAEEAAVGLAKEAFNHILHVSPQFSGDFVANWKVGVNEEDTSFKMNALGNKYTAAKGFDGLGAFQAMSRGSLEAINYAKSTAVWRKIKLGDRIFLSNSAHHFSGAGGELDMYAWKIEDGLINLRPINAGADHVARRGAANAAQRFGRIGASQLAYLRGR